VLEEFSGSSLQTTFNFSVTPEARSSAEGEDEGYVRSLKEWRRYEIINCTSRTKSERSGQTSSTVSLGNLLEITTSQAPPRASCIEIWREDVPQKSEF
jgi:hypothetical protein